MQNHPRIFADAGSPKPGAWDDAEDALDHLENGTLKELRDAAWEFKTEITSAMVMDPRPPVRTLRNVYAGLLNQDRIQAAHDRLLAAITAADSDLKAG